MKSSFVKAGGSDVKYISAASLFNKVRRCLETLGVAEWIHIISLKQPCEGRTGSSFGRHQCGSQQSGSNSLYAVAITQEVAPDWWSLGRSSPISPKQSCWMTGSMGRGGAHRAHHELGRTNAEGLNNGV